MLSFLNQCPKHLSLWVPTVFCSTVGLHNRSCVAMQHFASYLLTFVKLKITLTVILLILALCVIYELINFSFNIVYKISAQTSSRLECCFLYDWLFGRHTDCRYLTTSVTQNDASLFFCSTQHMG